MKQSNLLLNISDQQLQQAGLTRAQARKSLAALIIGITTCSVM